MHANAHKRVFILVDIKPCFYIRNSYSVYTIIRTLLIRTTVIYSNIDVLIIVHILFDTGKE